MSVWDKITEAIVIKISTEVVVFLHYASWIYTQSLIKNSFIVFLVENVALYLYYGS